MWVWREKRAGFPFSMKKENRNVLQIQLNTRYLCRVFRLSSYHSHWMEWVKVHTNLKLHTGKKRKKNVFSFCGSVAIMQSKERGEQGRPCVALRHHATFLPLVFAVLTAFVLVVSNTPARRVELAEAQVAAPNVIDDPSSVTFQVQRGSSVMVNVGCWLNQMLSFRHGHDSSCSSSPSSTAKVAPASAGTQGRGESDNPGIWGDERVQKMIMDQQLAESKKPATGSEEKAQKSPDSQEKRQKILRFASKGRTHVSKEKGDASQIVAHKERQLPLSAQIQRDAQAILGGTAILGGSAQQGRGQLAMESKDGVPWSCHVAGVSGISHPCQPEGVSEFSSMARDHGDTSGASEAAQSNEEAKGGWPRARYAAAYGIPLETYTRVRAPLLVRPASHTSYTCTADCTHTKSRFDSTANRTYFICRLTIRLLFSGTPPPLETSALKKWPLGSEAMATQHLQLWAAMVLAWMR